MSTCPRPFLHVVARCLSCHIVNPNVPCGLRAEPVRIASHVQDWPEKSNLTNNVVPSRSAQTSVRVRVCIATAARSRGRYFIHQVGFLRPVLTVHVQHDCTEEVHVYNGVV